MNRPRDEGEIPAAADPEDPAAGLDDGDVGLIRQMLKLSPTERLRSLERLVNDVRALRHGRRVSSP